jgi:hypothetical protein
LNLSGGAMFAIFRYGLLPVALFCVVVIAAGVHTFTENSIQKSTWPQTVVTVAQSQDFGKALAELRGEKNAFPDPHGTVSYVVGGKTYSWQGRGRDIGLTVMNPGDQIKLHYNPANPQQINTLVLLGKVTGSIILAVALVFLTLYVWFFWLRGFFRRPPGSHDSSGDAPESWAERASERISSHQRPVAISDRPAGKSFQDRAVTFGKR